MNAKLLPWLVGAVTLAVLVFTTSLYFKWPEMIMFVLASFLLAALFKRHILIAYVAYFGFSFVDVLIDYAPFGSWYEKQDGQKPPLFGEVLPEAYDDFWFVHLLLPFVIGLMASVFHKKATSK